MHQQWWYWVACIQAQMQPYRKQFSTKTPGGKVQAAICYNFWQLELLGYDFIINFERMQPFYIHCIKTIKKQDECIEKAYQCLGGDSFAQSLKDQDNNNIDIDVEDNSDNDNNKAPLVPTWMKVGAVVSTPLPAASMSRLTLTTTPQTPVLPLVLKPGKAANPIFISNSPRFPYFLADCQTWQVQEKE